LKELCELTEGYSGAEIEQAVVSGLFEAFAARRPLVKDDLIRATTNMVPLSVTQAERIGELRAWASTRAVAATAAEDWDSGTGLTRPSTSGGRVVEF